MAFKPHELHSLVTAAMTVFLHELHSLVTAAMTVFLHELHSLVTAARYRNCTQKNPARRIASDGAWTNWIAKSRGGTTIHGSRRAGHPQ